MDVVERIFEHMRGGRDRRYGADVVNVLSHSIQCGSQAEKAGASEALIAAALLHDIGHMINPDARAARERGEDARHEVAGEHFLSAWFGDAVTKPVLHHVAAKRYLTATDPAYYDKLSKVSKHTLELQGGPFTPEEAEAFIAQPFAEDGVRLRLWDEAAKDPDAEMPALEHFRPVLQAVLKPDLKS